MKLTNSQTHLSMLTKIAPEDGGSVGVETSMTWLVARCGKAVGHFSSVVFEKPRDLQWINKEYHKLTVELLLASSLQQVSSWEAVSCSAAQDILEISWNTKMLYINRIIISIYRIYSLYCIVEFISSFIVLRCVFKQFPIYSARNFVRTNRAEH